MTIYVDISSLALVRGVNDRAAIIQIEQKRGDASPWKIVFVENNQRVILPAGTVVAFGAKTQKKYDSELVVYESGFTLTDEVMAPHYAASPSFNSVALNTILAIDADAENDLPFIDLMAEVTWGNPISSAPTTTKTFRLRVHNDIVRGDEGSPTNLTTPIDWLEDNAAAVITAIGAVDSAAVTAEITNQVSALTPASIGAETPAGAQAKADAVLATADFNSQNVAYAAGNDAKAYADNQIAALPAPVTLADPQTIPSEKIFTAAVRSLAPLNGSANQVPNITQVRQQSRETAAPLVRWNFNAASGSTVKSVSSSVHDGTINGTTKSFVEGSAGYSRQLLLTSADAHVIAPSKEWFNRIHQGLPTTLVLEGESLVVAGIPPKPILSTGTPTTAATGFYLYQENNLLILYVGIAPSTGSAVNFSISGTLVKIVLTISGTTVTMTATNSAGTVFSETNTITTFSAGDSTYLARIGLFGESVLGGGHGMKISSLELYDRVITI